MALNSLSVVMSLDDDNFTTKVVRNTAALRNMNVEMNQTVNISGKLDAGVQHLGASFAGWSIALGAASEAFRELKMVTTDWAEKIIEVNTEVQKTTILLEGLSKAADQVGKATDAQSSMKGLLDMASNSPFKLETLTDTFVKLKTAGIDPMNGSMKALADSISAFGGDDSRLLRAGYAIQEMAGRGVLSLQNLRRQLGQDIPGAVALMARSLNMTIEELDQKVQTGTFASGHALNLMLEEFNRTYGGATGQLMQTFSGRISQLTNSLQRLALVAGGTVRPSIDNLFGDMSGGSNKNSFYAEAVSQISKINDMMKSPEMVASAITLNNTLRSMTITAGEFARTVIEWRGPIVEAVEIIGGLATAFVAAKVAVLAYEIAASGIGMVSGIIGGGISAISALPQALNMIASGSGLARNMLTAFGETLITSVVPGVTLATEGAAGLAVAMTGLTAAFAVVAIPTAIVAGLVMIEEHFRRISGQTEITTTALQRLLQGDITAGNVSKASEQLKDVEVHIAAMRKELAALDKDQELHNTAPPGVASATTASMRGFGAVDGVTEAINNQWANATKISKEGVERYRASVAADLTTLEIFQRDETTRIQTADGQRLAIEAKTHYDTMIASLESGFQSYETKYKDQMEQIARERDELVNTPGNHREAIDTLDDRSKSAAIEEMIGFNQSMNSLLEQEKSRFAEAAAAKNQTEVEFYKHSIALLEDYQTKKNAEMQRGVNDQGSPDPVGGSAAKDNKKAEGESITLIDTLTQRIAVMNARLDDTGTATAKLAAKLQDVSWQNLGTEKIEELKKLSTELDRLTEAEKFKQETMKAGKNIDNGMEKATEQLTLYINKLENAGLPESQQKVAELQMQMNHELDAAAAAFNHADVGMNGYGKAIMGVVGYLGLMIDAQNAVNREAAATDLATGEKLAAEGHSKFVSSLSAGARATLEAADHTKLYQDHLAAIKRDLDNGTLALKDYNAELARSKAGEAEYQQGTNNKVATAGAKADKPATNALDEMKTKIAEMSATLAGGDPQLAKWNAMIAESPALYARLGPQLRDAASQLTSLTEATKAHESAQRALETLKSNGAEATDARATADAEFKMLNTRGRVLEVEKQILEYKIRQDALVQKAANATKNPAIMSDPNAAATATQDLSDAKAQRDKNDADDASLRIMEEMGRLESEVEASRQKGAGAVKDETNAIDQQAQALRNLLAASNLNGQQRQQVETDIANWTLAKDNEITRKNREMLDKTLADWSNTSKQIQTLEVDVLNKFDDTMAKMLTTGKANWKSLADSVIEEIERMILKMLEAEVIGQAMTALGLGQSNESIIGTKSYDATNNASSSLGGIGALIMKFLHGGGIAGSESTFQRSVSAASLMGATRFHTGGLAGNEVPIIAEKGEGVFTEGQMGAIGDITGGYASMAASIAAMVSSMNSSHAVNSIAAVAPQQFAPPQGYSGGNGTGNIAFNLTNQAGTPLQATQTGSRYQGEQYVVDVVLKHMQQPGPLRSAVRGG